MEAFFQKIQSEDLEIKLGPPCSPAALSQAESKMLTLFTALPAEQVKFLAVHNGFTCDEDGITLYFVADPQSAVESLKSATDPRELLEANIQYHHEGLPDSYIVLGECDFGLFVYDSEATEYVILDPDGFEAYEAYESLEDLLLDFIYPEFEDEDDV